MVVAFTEIRFKGDLNRLDDSNSISESVDIAGVNYLIIPDLDQRIIVSGSNKSGIEVKSFSGDLLKNLKYEILGDTLNIISLELLKKEAFNISIFVPNSTFRGLASTNAMVTISDLDQETLDISQHDGWIKMSASNKISKLNLNVQNSARFNLVNGEVDTLNAIMNNAEVLTNEQIKLVKGSMTNDSYLHLVGTSEIQIKKDESSRLTSSRLILN
jgi:hypothetical protein